MDWINHFLAFLFIGLSFISGVECTSREIVAMAAAGTVSFLMLCVIIFFIAISFSWGGITKNYMIGNGKVKMPKSYFKMKMDAKKRKKEEIKKRLLSTSANVSLANGQPPVQTVDRAKQKSVPNGASWVQGWSQRNNAFNEEYEEKDMTLELGEEHDDEFRIETVLVDNEVLDVGPFKTTQANEQPAPGDVYNDPYIYTTIDKTSIRPSYISSTVADVSPRGRSFEDTLIKL